jgi:hypothetical protein
VREDSVQPRVQSGASARPLNFTVRRQMLETWRIGCTATAAPLDVA